MLKSISWQQYLLALLIGSTIYYLIILFFYYRQDVRHWVANFPSRRSRLGKFISGCTERDASDLVSGPDHGESREEIDSVSAAEGNPIIND